LKLQREVFIKPWKEGVIMNSRLQPGVAHEFSYTMPPERTVPHLLPESAEFGQMPDVLATGYMVGLVEWTCIQAVNPYLDWPREQTVGIHVDLSHRAATPPGLMVTVRVNLTEVDGRRLVFAVEADDGVDLICKGSHQRFVIDAARFNQKAEAKLEAATG
jgi:fluoroacetyl-CoA thioesterase